MKTHTPAFKAPPHFSKSQISDQLVFQLRRRLNRGIKPQVLRIIGLPACGKTNLAIEVQEMLKHHNVSSLIYEDTLEIIYSREKRSAEHLSGIDYNIYDLQEMRSNLQSLLNGDSIIVGSYSHQKGGPDEKEELLHSQDVIILDGYGWQNGIFRHLLEKEDTITVSLLPLDTRLWRQHSIARDNQERNYSEKEAEARFGELKKTFLSNANDIPIFEIDNYYVVSRIDRTRKRGDTYLYTPGPKNVWPHIDLEHERMSNVFLAYQFSDVELVKGLVMFLREHGFTVLDGKMLNDRLSIGILDKIRQSYYFLAVVTRRDELKKGNYTTSSWVLEEKGAALMRGCKAILLVEEGVDSHYIGHLQGDLQRIDFTVINFSSKFHDVLYQLQPTL